MAAPVDLLLELEPLIEVIQPLILKLSLLAGGIFGAYLILIVVRVHYERKKVKLLKDIKFNLDQANKHNNIPHSRTQIGTMKKLWNRIKP